MRAWLLPSFTGIQSLTLGTAPDPTPGPDQIILNVQFASLNPADAYLAQGQYPGKPVMPHILGRDAVGTVTALGTNVTNIRPGDTRIILRSQVGVTQPGTLAEFVAVDAAYTAPVPDGWTPEQAAAAPLVYMTAWQAITQWHDLPENPIVLVTGATGGVGVATIQLCKARGWRVAALSRSKEKSATLQQLPGGGADWTLDPQNPTWRDQLKNLLDTDPQLKSQISNSQISNSEISNSEISNSEISNSEISNSEISNLKSQIQSPPRIALAIDNIGGDTLPRVLDVMGDNGRISIVGRLAGPVPNFNTAALFFRRLRLGGVAVGAYTNAEARAAWEGVVHALTKTGARPLIDHIYDFNAVPEAFARLAQGPMGKVLIRLPA